MSASVLLLMVIAAPPQTVVSAQVDANDFRDTGVIHFVLPVQIGTTGTIHPPELSLQLGDRHVDGATFAAARLSELADFEQLIDLLIVEPSSTECTGLRERLGVTFARSSPNAWFRVFVHKGGETQPLVGLSRGREAAEAIPAVMNCGGDRRPQDVRSRVLVQLVEAVETVPIARRVIADVILIMGSNARLELTRSGESSLAEAVSDLGRPIHLVAPRARPSPRLEALIATSQGIIERSPPALAATVDELITALGRRWLVACGLGYDGSSEATQLVLKGPAWRAASSERYKLAARTNWRFLTGLAGGVMAVLLLGYFAWRYPTPSPGPVVIVPEKDDDRRTGHPDADKKEPDREAPSRQPAPPIKALRGPCLKGPTGESPIHDKLVIGSGVTCDVKLEGLSERHAQITVRSDDKGSLTYTITELESSVIFVNGRRISRAHSHEKCQRNLAPDDRITFGTDAELTFNP